MLPLRFFLQRGFLLLFLLLVGTSKPGLGQAQTLGKWTTLSYTMPINPVHVALLHNGKILVVAGSGNCPPGQSGCPTGPPYGTSNNSGALLLDPTNGNITRFSLAWDMFCNAMVVLPDGRVFINGGTQSYDPFHGQLKSSIFDPSSNTFNDTTNMAHGRWYPTLVTLADGRIMTFSGVDENVSTNSTVEFYTVGSGWSQPFNAPFNPDLYPRMHLLPSGKVFYAGPPPVSNLFNPSTNTWTLDVANTNYSGDREYGSTVLLALTPANNYDPQVLTMGGNSPATATTEIIDLGASSPKWTNGPSMSQARIEMNAVILPNGTVLAMGGSINDEDLTTKSLNADLYIPATSTVPASITSAGANAFARLYHSVALLLPDATVWLAGGNPTRGNYESHIEVYQPAYLFQSNGSLATRPTITSAPGSISYGSPFTVQTPDAANITSAVLIRAAASTHSFGMDQRMVGMSFTAGAGSLTVTAPPNGNIAPPGYYMLFLLNSQGVPSVSTFVQLSSSSPPPAPTVTSITPPSGSANGGTAVTITGTGFAAGATVSLGGTTATGVTVVSSTSITATTAAHAAATVDVVVSTGGQNATLTGGFTYTSATGGGIGFVQAGTGPTSIQSSNSKVVVPYPAAQTAGNLNIVAVGWGDTTTSISSVTDSKGNVYTRTIGPTVNGGQQSIYYAKNIAGGTNTVTVTFNQAASYPDVRILEYSGLDTTSPLDVTASAVGTGTAASSGAATTTAANELIFGTGTAGGNGFSGPGSGYVTRVMNIYGSLAEDKIVSATGSYSTTGTVFSASWIMQMATFRGSGQGSGGGNPAPTVSSISPTSGTASGGTAVTITGTGFLSGATVNLGGTAATAVTVSSSTKITATTPAHAAGAADVTVMNTDGQNGTLTQGFTYTSGNPAPAVSSISPASGTANGGTAVTITGTGFLSGATVSLGGTAATAVTISSSTKITATTPAHAAGAADVTVMNTDGQSGTLTGGFTYTGSNPAPAVSSISPASGTANGGTAVTITGTGFLSGATVSLGGTAATAVTVSSSTKITATTPAHAAGAVNVVVMNTDGQSGTLSGGYTYTSASGGGIAFVQAGTGPSTIKASNPSVAVAFPAAQTAGNLNVVAVGWGDTTTSISSVTDSKGNVYTRAVGPTVNGGQQSIYYAKNIAGGTNTVTVTFNQAASYPDVRILEYSGLDTTSPLDVTAGAVGSGTAASSGASTTTAANELIFGTGTAGGNGFSGAGSGYTSRVMNIYGSLAEDKIVSSTGSYSTTGAVASSTWIMQMATFKGSGQGSGGGNPAPTVSSISPTSGTANGGTAVTITGTGFLTGATLSLGGTAATSVTVSSSTKITATTPAHAAGAADVVVMNTDGQSGTLTGGFTYTGSNPAPTVNSISPTSGTANGGTAVTITGTGFLSGATVKLGGTAATGVTLVSGTSITATTAAHAAGIVDVVVTNSDGQGATLTGGYTYTSATGGGIGFVQAGTGPTSIQSSNSKVVVPYPAAQTAGNLNVVAVGWGDTTTSISSVTDSKGNVYTRAVGPTVNGGQQSIYYAKNIAGGTNTVTVTFNQAASYPDVRILEYSGLDTTSPLDVTAGAVGTGTAASSGAATTTVANELIFGTGTAGGNGFSGAGSGYTSRVMNIYGSLAEDKIVSSTGSYSATGTVASSTWIMQMATFKAQQ